METELSKLEWQRFLNYHEEKHGEYGWYPNLTGVNVVDRNTGKLVGFRQNIPERCFILEEWLLGTPWERFVSVTTVTN